jgi:hypothetical protein
MIGDALDKVRGNWLTSGYPISSIRDVKAGGMRPTWRMNPNRRFTASKPLLLQRRPWMDVTRRPAHLPWHIALLASICLSAFPAWGKADEPSANPTTLTFAGGGTIRMTFNVGTFEVVGAADEKITVSWHSASRERESRVKVSLRQSSAKEALLEVDGPRGDVHYRIEVPRQSSVILSMRAGDLGVRGVRGSLHANLLAGNLELRVAEPRDYRTVRASVTTGGLTAKPWQVDTGGLWRSFEASGTGEFEIEAHVLAGQLTIRRE